MAASLKARMSLLVRITSDSRCTRSDLAVAVVLLIIRYNSNTGRCDPSMSSVAKDAGITQRTAIKAVRHLTELGYLEVKICGGTIGEPGPTNRYLPRFDINNDSPLHVLRDTACPSEQGVSSATGDVEEGREGVFQATPEPVREPVNLSRSLRDGQRPRMPTSSSEG
jgi:hypothetical protein